MAGIGFIGVGNMGMGQVNAFSKVRGVKVVAGADLSPASRDNFTKAQPEAAVYEDHQALLADPNVEAVVVVVPTGLHKNIVIDALKAGKHVLVEKPMARTVAECKAMNKAAEQADRVLMVAHCRRFCPGWGKFRKLVEQNKIGRPIHWRHFSAGKGPGSWFMDDKLGGGPIMDGAVHNQDFANLLFGKPIKVVAMGDSLRDVTALTTVTAAVEYEHGDKLILSWSWGTPAYGGIMDALGTKGSLVFGTADLEPPVKDQETGYYCEVRYDDGKKKLHSYKMKGGSGIMYVNQAKHFHDLITGKATENLSSGDEGIKAVAVAETILKAARKGGASKVTW